MRTSLEIAEEIFGPSSHEGWRVHTGHAVSDGRFRELVRALDQVRQDGRDAQREHEAQLRRMLAEHLRAVRAERASLSTAIAQVKAAFDEMEGRFAAKVVEMIRVMENEIQAPAIPRNK